MPSLSPVGKESKQKKKFKRFYSWFCFPITRGKNSYIEQVTPKASVSSKIQPRSEVVALDKYDTKSTSQHDERLEADIRPRAQYPHTLFPHASSRPQASELLDWDFRDTFAPSTYCTPASRKDAQSPEFDAPRVQGQARVRSRSAKNKDLPGCLCAQPRPLTKEYLDINDRRYSDSIQPLIGRIPNAFSHRDRRWSNSNPDALRNEERLQFARENHRSQRKQNALPLRRSNDRSQRSRSQQSRDASRGPRMYQQARGRSLHARPDIVPLSSDSNKVLVHSKSRGFKVVRNLMSVEGLRDMVMQPRHLASLERMAEDDRQACEELTSITTVIASDQQHCTVAPRLHAPHPKPGRSHSRQ